MYFKGAFPRQWIAAYCLAIVCCLACVWPLPGAYGKAPAAYPNRPIKVVVPFTPGGGSDTFARIMKAAVEEHHLLPQPLVIINVGGASGTIGSRRVKNEKPDGYTVLLLHDAILTAKYAAKVNYGPEAFRSVVATGESAMLVAVRDDSPFESLPEMLEAASRRPDEITFAVNMGAPTHFAGLLLQRAYKKARLRFVQSGDGPSRFAALKGGHVAVTTFSLSEFDRFQAAGIRALAILSKQRHRHAPNIPTAREQGVDVVQSIVHYWWMPKDTPSQRADVFAQALIAAMQTTSMRATLEEFRIDPIVISGDALRRHLQQANDEIAAVDSRATLPLPNLPFWIGALALLTGAPVFWQRVRRRTPATKQENPSQTKKARTMLALCVLLVSLYAASVTRHWAPLGASTALFVFLTGGVLSQWRRRQLPTLVVSAAAAGVVFHLLFTQLFVIDL